MTDDSLPSQPDLDDLLDQLERTTQLSRTVLTRVVAEVVAHHGETVEQYVRRRHRELQASGWQNKAIWSQVGRELTSRVVAPPALSERQLRRIVYG
jgi:DNA polymerase IIIc chi subunit